MTSWLSVAWLLLRVANLILGEAQHRRSFKAGQRNMLDRINAETETLNQKARAARQRARFEHDDIAHTASLPDDGYRRD